ncbi:MAG: porin [Pusillimonas sp.]|jgi:predicted porin|nr:porin [Pusillimonas sp.]
MNKKRKNKYVKPACLLSVALLAGPTASAVVLTEGEQHSVELYGSVRMQLESVHPGNSGPWGSYVGLRDAYTRVGLKAEYRFAETTAVFGQLEVPFDTANFRISDPYDQGGAGRDHRQRIRIAQVGVRTVAGTLIAGQQWMPYYNAVAAPVDHFSSYYSGFATYTTFRVPNTVSYYSPSIYGFTLSGSYTSAAGNRRSTSRIDDRRIQAALSYAFGDTRLAVGMDDRGDTGLGKDRIYGFSASHQAGPWYFAAKYEVFDTNNHTPGAFSKDGNKAFNVFASYNTGPYTFKAMFAKVQNYGDNIVHLGVDYQYNKDLKFFAEFYREGSTASIVEKRGGLADFNSASQGGRAFLVGFRYDF